MAWSKLVLGTNGMVLLVLIGIQLASLLASFRQALASLRAVLSHVSWLRGLCNQLAKCWSTVMYVFHVTTSTPKQVSKGYRTPAEKGRKPARVDPTTW